MDGLHSARALQPQRTRFALAAGLARSTGHYTRQDTCRTRRVRRYQAPSAKPAEPALSESGQVLIGLPGRIRTHFAKGHTETSALIECLYGDAERERNRALSDYLDIADRAVIRLINSLCAELETDGAR